MFYTLDLLGTRHLASTLDSMPDIVRDILRVKLQALNAKAKDLVVSNIRNRLQGTGKLADAVETYLEEEGYIIRAGIRIDMTRAPYARIQDKGGTIPPHMIFPRHAKRLAFTGFLGDKVIVKRVSHPGAVIPGAHFTTDAYKGLTAEISRELKKAVVEGIRAKMRQSNAS